MSILKIINSEKVETISTFTVQIENWNCESTDNNGTWETSCTGKSYFNISNLINKSTGKLKLISIVNEYNPDIHTNFYQSYYFDNPIELNGASNSEIDINQNITFNIYSENHQSYSNENLHKPLYNINFKYAEDGVNFNRDIIIKIRG